MEFNRDLWIKNEIQRYFRIRKEKKEHKYVKKWLEYFRYQIEFHAKHNPNNLRFDFGRDLPFERDRELIMYKVENRKRIIQSYPPYHINQHLTKTAYLLEQEKRIRTDDVCNDINVACRILNLDHEYSEMEIIHVKDCIGRHGFIDWDSYIAIKMDGYME